MLTVDSAKHSSLSLSLFQRQHIQHHHHHHWVVAVIRSTWLTYLPIYWMEDMSPSNSNGRFTSNNNSSGFLPGNQQSSSHHITSHAIRHSCGIHIHVLMRLSLRISDATITTNTTTTIIISVHYYYHPSSRSTTTIIHHLGPLRRSSYTILSSYLSSLVHRCGRTPQRGWWCQRRGSTRTPHLQARTCRYTHTHTIHTIHIFILCIQWYYSSSCSYTMRCRCDNSCCTSKIILWCSSITQQAINPSTNQLIDWLIDWSIRKEGSEWVRGQHTYLSSEHLQSPHHPCD